MNAAADTNAMQAQEHVNQQDWEDASLRSPANALLSLAARDWAVLMGCACRARISRGRAVLHVPSGAGLDQTNAHSAQIQIHASATTTAVAGRNAIQKLGNAALIPRALAPSRAATMQKNAAPRYAKMWPLLMAMSSCAATNARMGSLNAAMRTGTRIVKFPLNHALYSAAMPHAKSIAILMGIVPMAASVVWTMIIAECAERMGNAESVLGHAIPLRAISIALAQYALEETAMAMVLETAGTEEGLKTA